MTKLTALLIGLILPFTAYAEAEKHDCIAIVVDGSGSMRDAISDDSDVRKITAAKTALKSVIDQIPSATHVGVLLFVGNGYGLNTQLKWLAPIGPIDKDQLKSAIDNIRPDGGTPLGHAIKAAADELLKARAAQQNYGTYQLLVVTDGEATDGNLADTYAEEVKKPERRIQLDVIGIGMREKHKLSRIADRYWGANDPIALNRALQTAVQVETTNPDAAKADYDLLQGLPDDVAKLWLADVTNMDLANWPIGEQKPEPPPPANAQNADPNAAQNQPANQQPAANAAQGRQKGCSASPGGINPAPTGIIALCLMSLVALRRRLLLARVRNK
ncbi:hypothetical protein A2318_00070 [Candidatus Uhrbacteria bacterium RIFOXYB2_FULL_45_11]|uniref:VWFA domain-containing protein n=1 Tax=Candidatus Uhrbacteria bacterium RIFOXYB2_FULL_45_11 TaxID=1802421 RepID=A0A1F7W7A8_9BACT|nr:MAG: hypothetical protein A2318_00070 [Candidatus Uhrbacteria bacterium RIFOXYB2_FULL_45_11]